MLSKPATILSVVDFPQPDGPTSTNSSLSLTSRSKSFTVKLLWEPYVFLYVQMLTKPSENTPPSFSNDATLFRHWKHFALSVIFIVFHFHISR